ncbi:MULTISPECIES: hypothetical protein [unclassified Streptomyces]|uniref:hypothetical protein n=1 Tax=unclassified Streptomyces TaxID=2593676 RepID=UPI0005F89DC0|nr:MULTISPECIES: hypothetical protein [unclassified Streptomyces]KJY31443.1 hypothetical protein VR45_25045 [Streptomyces sp. NRRL S-495]KOV25430.1 hypothetical protein ADK60_22930 [Streptomyces sp. XY431]
MRKATKLTLAATMSAAALFAVAGPAAASNTAVTGAAAYYDPNRNNFGLQDTKSDGNSVFIEYWINDVKQPRIVNYNGNGSWRDYVVTVGEGGALRWKLCVDISFSPDRCSGMVYDRV